MGKKIPGPKPTDPSELENVYVCIDTSGSMEYDEMCDAFTHIERLMKLYKDTKVKVIYWDFEVEAVYDKIDRKTLSRTKPAGGGGTDVECVFEYLERDKDFKNQRKHTIMIFTDGGFPALSQQIGKKYKTELVWVIATQCYDSCKDRKDLTGIIAPFNTDD